MTADELNNLVDNFLPMDITVKLSKSRTDLLFIKYMSIVWIHIFKCLLKKNPKVAVNHWFPTIKMFQLKRLFLSALDFAKSFIMGGFNDFMKHAVDNSEALEKVDTGPPARNTIYAKINNDRSGRSESKTPGLERTKQNSDSGKPWKFLPQPCTQPEFNYQFHRIDGYKLSSPDMKKKLNEQLRSKLAKDGPARSTRRQSLEEATYSTSGSGAVGRLANP